MSGNEMVPRDASEEDAAAAAEFERELFKHGTLEFDFDAYLEEEEGYLQRSRQMMQEEGWTGLLEILGDGKEDTRHQLIWQREFSGRIPKRWKLWINAWDAFKRAGELGLQLNPTLIDAGVSCSAEMVAMEAGCTQRLNVQHLAFLLSRSDLFDHQRKEILSAQRERGISEEVIRVATRRAQEARERIREKKREKPKLEGPEISS